MSTKLPDSLFLACDVGNSRVKIGLFSVTESGWPKCHWNSVYAVSEAMDWDGLRASLPSEITISACYLAGSNPALREQLRAAWSNRLPGPSPRVIEHPAVTGLSVALDEPEKVGVDRLLNAMAVNLIRSADAGAIIIDSGTATTVDVVDPAGAFRGGAILPGFELSARSLHQYTALLPLMTIEQLAEEPHEPLGKNTRSAIRSGLFWGQLGAVRELVTRLSADPLFRGQHPLLVLTGGGAVLLTKHLPEVHWEPHLSLQGLVIAGRVQSMSEDTQR